MIPTTGRVTFLVTNAPTRVIDVPPRATLLRAAVRARMPIGRSCRGVAVCAACRVFIVDGPDAVEPIGVRTTARKPGRDRSPTCSVRRGLLPVVGDCCARCGRTANGNKRSAQADDCSPAEIRGLKAR